MPLLNYTTTVEAAKTVGEIQKILSDHDAKSILIDYAKDRSIKALAFKVATPQGEVGIRLPVDPDAVLKVLERQWQAGQVPYRYVNRAQAVRVAWRNIRGWVASQMAILETEMVQLEQIFLPYVITRDGRTFFELAVDGGFLQLKEGKHD